ncbi:MAG: glycerol-3-phosphate dehydrogenase C-terminal domain-containing protein, partial [Solirubrobacteraceae bacterium]
QAVEPDELPRVEGVAAEAYPALAGRYGHGAHELLAIAGERPALALAIVPGCPDLLAEAALAARREQARSIGDVLLRRTRLGLLAGRELTLAAVGSAAAAEPVQRVGEVLAGELGWDERRLGVELERFAEEARAEGIAALAEAREGAPADLAR